MGRPFIALCLALTASPLLAAGGIPLEREGKFTLSHEAYRQVRSLMAAEGVEPRCKNHRNVYFKSPTGALAAASLSLRIRTIDEEEAVVTVKHKLLAEDGLVVKEEFECRLVGGVAAAAHLVAGTTSLWDLPESACTRLIAGAKHPFAVLKERVKAREALAVYAESWTERRTARVHGLMWELDRTDFGGDYHGLELEIEFPEGCDLRAEMKRLQWFFSHRRIPIQLGLFSKKKLTKAVSGGKMRKIVQHMAAGRLFYRPTSWWRRALRYLNLIGPPRA